MSVLLTDELDPTRLGLQPGDHEHLIIEMLTEEEFAAQVGCTSFTSVIGSSAKATYLSEILGQEVAFAPHSPSWMPPLTTGTVLYVASFTTSRNQGEPGLREVREARKTYFRVLIDPLGCASVVARLFLFI